MTESELLEIIRDSNVPYASLFAQMVTINFAMIVAIYYFLRRASRKLKLAAFGFYLIGMLSLIGLMVTEANFKMFAISGLAAIAPAQLSSVGESYLAFRTSWISTWASMFMNAAMWIMIAVVAYLLFWRESEHASFEATAVGLHSETEKPRVEWHFGQRSA